MPSGRSAPRSCTAEGLRQAQILTADGDKQGTILRAEGDKQSAILRAEGQAQAIGTVFQAIHDNDPDPKLLAYQYLQTLPQIAQGPGSTCLDDPERADRRAEDAELGVRRQPPMARERPERTARAVPFASSPIQVHRPAVRPEVPAQTPPGELEN